MAFSKAAGKKAARKAPWPDLRYSLATGECKLFFKPEDVPKGWVKHAATKFSGSPDVQYNKEDLIRQLLILGHTIDPKWGSAHLKKVLDDISPSR